MAGVPGKSGRKADPDAARRLRADDPQRLIKWIDLPPEGNSNPIPEMPAAPWFKNENNDLEQAASWSVRAISLWNTLWRSPQSTMWQPDIHPMLDRYLYLSEQMWTWGEITTASYNQMLQIEIQHGLTPKSMKDLYWRVHANPEVEPQLASVHGMNGIKKVRERMTDF
jgi:hypothetical protein